MRGVVKFFKPEKGWGAITGDGLPAGQDAWVHYSAVVGSGYRELHAGDVVELEVEEVDQDGFRYRALDVRRVSAGRAPTLRRSGDQVLVVPDDTPETPLRPRRPRGPGPPTRS